VLRTVLFGVHLSLTMPRKSTPPWGRSRGYIHFDGPLPDGEAEALVKDEQRVASRAFWPLISFRTIERRWNKRERKWKKKSRPIAYASHADSHIFSYYSWKLAEPYEALLNAIGLSPVVLAYRKHANPSSTKGKGKASFHFAAEAFSAIAIMGECDAIAMDIERFFDSIPHDALKANWSQLLGKTSLPPDHYAVFKAVTKFSCVPLRQVRAALGIGKRRFEQRRSIRMSSDEFDKLVRQRGVIEVNRKPGGIPQGLPISGLLANLVMLQVDEAMDKAAKALGGSYRRYSDDVLIMAPPGKAAGLEALCKNMLSKLQLNVNDAKTGRSAFRQDAAGVLRVDTPLQYLGLEFDGNRVLVRPQTLVKFGKRMRRAVRQASRAAERLMKKGGPARIRRRNLYARFSHLRPHKETPLKRRPKGSFMRYAMHAANAVENDGKVAHFKEQIRHQLRGQWELLQDLIADAERSLRDSKKA